MAIETYKIETKDEAHSYLRDLLKIPSNRSIDEITRHAHSRIKDASLRDYFINKGKEMLVKIKNKSIEER